MGHNKQTMKPGFSLEVDNQAPLFTDAHAGWEQGTCHQKPIHKCVLLAGDKETTPLWNTLGLSCGWGGLTGTFWVDSRFSSDKNLHSEALSFHYVIQVPKQIGNFPAKSRFYMLPRTYTAALAGWEKSTHSLCSGSGNSTASCQGVLQKEDFCFHQVFKLTSTNESCFRDTIYQCLPAYCVKAATTSISCSSCLQLPQQSALVCCNLWHS